MVRLEENHMYGMKHDIESFYERNNYHTMSVLFNMICSYKRRFNVSTCETLLQKIPVDAQSLIQRKEIHVKQIEEDISKTLQNPEKSQMRIAHTVEVLNLIDENNMINLLKYIIYFCEVVDRHLPFLESQSEVPPRHEGNHS
ncbi:unnamed protein product [Trifolium pratense]|uniref:Uncharacterized protein n=1 Tax=Trifolium pratense TaxID=57577 RepID=A0ACB0ILR9_TRIPR|nr:unnamed protein product [Trifolium pratense]